MSRNLACTVHLLPPGQVWHCAASLRKPAGRLSGRALGRRTWLIRIQLERRGLWVLAQTEPWVTP